MKKILIIGATSAIAEATARVWAERGDQLFLVARNQERLNALTSDLSIRSRLEVEGFCMDANDLSRHKAMLQRASAALGKIDIAFIAHGTLSNQKACEQSVELTLQEINTNALSAIALLTELANVFENQKNGTLAIIGSVAGDRGRQSNYVYGSAKALVTAFTSGLRQRLHKSGVAVVTIKPGFVDTPMTAEFKKGALWATPQKVAKYIVTACDTQKGEIYVPSFWWLIMFIIKSIPQNLFKKMSL